MIVGRGNNLSSFTLSPSGHKGPNNSLSSASDSETVSTDSERLLLLSILRLTILSFLGFSDFADSAFTIWEWEYEQYDNGAITRLPVEAYIQVMRLSPYHMAYWEESGAGFSPDFVAFMEENVISQLE